MKYIIAFVVMFCTVGCASINTNYVPVARYDKSTAQKIVEQIVMEQPPKVRPQMVYVFEEYIGFDFGSVVNEKTGVVAVSPNSSVAMGVSNSESTIRQVSDRIYLNSIGKVTTYKKGNYYIIRLINERGELYKNILTRSEEKAKAFADAIESLKKDHLY